MSDRLSEQELQDIRDDEAKLAAMTDVDLVLNLLGRAENLSHAYAMDRGDAVLARKTDWRNRARAELLKRLSELSRLRSERVTLAKYMTGGPGAYADMTMADIEAAQALARQVLTEEETGR